MHGIKEPDVKEMAESTNMGESSIKEDTKVSYHEFLIDVGHISVEA